MHDESHAALLESIKQATSVHAIAKLTTSKTLQDVLSKIEMYGGESRDVIGEDDGEYKLIVMANKMTVDIDAEIGVVHKFIRDHYAPKFPELEKLVRNELDYARVVKAIGNEEDVTKVDLRSILPSSIVMIVTVTASSTNGRELTTKELNAVLEGCEMAFELDTARRKILEYVESRMNVIAPNLSAIVGSNVSAALLGFAGGLSAFCAIPACNVIVLGQAKKTNAGLSAVGQKRHQGIVYGCEFVERTPEEFKRRAARLVSAKCVLAARVDRSKEAPDGSVGRKFAEEIEKKLEKEMEPPPGKNVKALPIPDEGPKKRRGGKRVRRMKEKYAITELSKQQNRMSFGVAEEEVGVMDETVGMGMIGGSTGKIRLNTSDPRTKVGVSKNIAKRQRLISGHTSGHHTTSGLSSSLAFTPVQGIELENPEAAKLRAEKEKSVGEGKYFSGGTFMKAQKK
ncbi:U4/U6-U5 snRNP complex subunit prp31 [Nowakowskiella sp. JEL0407]|nr:U4/U6-U5 snRNP complex subunit prp31 [Nowakowskiella sp. JEL0407]